MKKNTIWILLLAGLWACSADKAIEEGTDCDETCPVGASKISAKQASGSCGADGKYVPTGEVEAAGQCAGEGECQVICMYPECSEDKTLVITADEFRCEANTDPCKDVDCDGHGTCKIVYDAAACDCDPGYEAEGLHCVVPEDALVETVTPNTGTVDQEAVFTVEGTSLPMGLTADVENCTGVSFTERSDTLQKFVCTPTEPGTMQRIIYEEKGGKKLFEDEVVFACEDCTIGGACFDEDDVNPDNPCQVCAPDEDAKAWSDNDGVDCDDGQDCNGADTCGGGTCSVHEGNPCPDDGDFCNGEETCDDGTGDCVSTGDPCVDDGDFCNGDEYCDGDAGECKSTGDPCDDDGTFCNGDEYCDGDAGECKSTGDPCDPGRFCDEDAAECQLEIPAHDPNPTVQREPDVDMWDDGSFVIVWRSYVDPTTKEDIHARVFDATGAPKTDVITVNTSNAYQEKRPRVAALGNGGFVVVWEKNNLRVFDGAGAPVTDVLAFTEGDSIEYDTVGDLYPDVAAGDEDGNFAVIWQPLEEYNVYSLGRYRHRVTSFDASGTNVGSFVTPNYSIGESGTTVSPGTISMGCNGDFVTAWAYPQSGMAAVNSKLYSPPLVGGQQYGYSSLPHGLAEDPEIAFASNCPDDEGAPIDFGVAVWLFDSSSGTKQAGVWMARYSYATGAMNNPEKVNQSSDRSKPHVATSQTQAIVVVWRGDDSDGEGVKARYYASNGVPEDEFLVNVNEDFGQYHPRTAMDSTGNYVIVWTHETGDQDSDIRFRLFLQ